MNQTEKDYVVKRLQDRGRHLNKVLGRTCHMEGDEIDIGNRQEEIKILIEHADFIIAYIDQFGLKNQKIERVSDTKFILKEARENDEGYNKVMVNVFRIIRENQTK